METKSCIRKRILAVRGELSEAERYESSRIIAKKLRCLKAYNDAECLLGFVGYGSEVDTIPFLEQAVSDGKRVFCPVSREDKTMEFYRFISKEVLIKGYKNIPEPPDNAEKFDRNSKKVFLLMPGVAFDKKKHRIGYGKGFYDRYLADFSPDFTAAICFDCQIVEKIPVETHDFIPDIVLTQTEEIV